MSERAQQLRPAGSGSCSSSLTARYVERMRREEARGDSRSHRGRVGLVLGALLITGGVMTWRTGGTGSQWSALLLGCAGGFAAVASRLGPLSSIPTRILIACFVLLWGLGVLAAFARDRTAGVYTVANGALSLIVLVIIHRAFRESPRRRRSVKRPAVDLERVTSIPVGPSASERWQEKIVGEKAEDRRWQSLRQSLMIGIFATGWCALAAHLADPVTHPGATILGFAMAGACVAVFIWSLFSPLRAWIAVGILLAVTLFGLAWVDRAAAFSIGFSVLLAWLASLVGQLRDPSPGASDARRGSGGQRGIF